MDKTDVQKGLDSTKRFSNRADNYVRYRPGYPKKIVSLLHEDCGLAKNSVIADVGSGTGKLTQLFLENGNRVFGVEPNKEMREAGERSLNHFSNFTSVNGTAEATTLPDGSADFITVGTAFHWFDHEKCHAEFLRVLKSKGWVVIVLNRRRRDAGPFLTAYEELTHEFSMDNEHIRRKIEMPVVRQFFRRQPRFEKFYHEQQFDFDGLKGRLLSSSNAPEAGQPRHEEMLAALRQIFDTHQQNGRILFQYEAEVYYGYLT